MLDTFAAAGHHQYAKGARLYCQLIKRLESLPEYKEIFEHFNAYGNHVVRYSCHEWSSTWCDICIEQRLMKAAKSEGGLSRGIAILATSASFLPTASWKRCNANRR